MTAMKVIAQRHILYNSRQYRPGEVIQDYELEMLEAWKRSGAVRCEGEVLLEEDPPGGTDEPDPDGGPPADALEPGPDDAPLASTQVAVPEEQPTTPTAMASQATDIGSPGIPGDGSDEIVKPGRPRGGRKQE